MRVSIAMATYNAGQHLGTQLQSLAEQSTAPAELVISDDASVDDTAAIVSAFSARAPFPVHFRTNATRQGWQKNFVLAAQRCEGDVIAFCDHDDYWFPAKIELLSRSAATQAWTALVHRDAFMYSSGIVPQPSEMRNGAPFPRSAAFYGGFDGHRLAFRRELLPWLDLQGVFEDWLFDAVIAHDRLIMLAALTVGEVRYLDRILTLFRRHDAQITRDAERPSFGPDYSRRADVVANWIDGLHTAGERGLAPPARIAEMEGVLRRLSRALSSRAELYEAAGHWLRIKRLSKMVGARSYVDRNAGGLGLRALAKDAHYTLGRGLQT